MPSTVTRLRLTAFRSYPQAGLDLDAAKSFVILTGVNGAGKTNLLEAISLFAPGRGLRGSPLRDLQYQGTVPVTQSAWAVAGHISHNGEQRKIGTGLDESTATARRTVRIDGKSISGTASLGDDWAILWLTPQMDRLFTEGPATRRRFLDRLTVTLYPDHSSQVAAYEKAMRERNRLLSEQGTSASPAWLDAIEARIAVHGIATAAARLEMATALTHEISERFADTSGFVRPTIALEGDLEQRLSAGEAASDLEDDFRQQMATNRRRDGETGRQEIGPHRTDMRVTHVAKGLTADLASTGEQKALLTTLVLGQSGLVKRLRGAAPILLLDEIAAHLDEGRREALLDHLKSYETQCFITGTEANSFQSLRADGQFFTVENGSVKNAD